MFILLYPPVVTGRLNPVDNVNDLDDDIKYHRWKWPQLKARPWCYYPGRQNK